MKKSVIALALILGTISTAQAAALSGEFCMFDSGGAVVRDFGWSGDCDDQVTGDIDIGAGTFNVASPQAFFGINWTTKNGTVFGPGTYGFDTIEGGTYADIIVGTGQIGGHILFDYGPTLNIDVVLVWDVTLSSVNATTILTTYTSTDNAGSGLGLGGVLGSDPYDLTDGILGNSMLDGAFPGFNANFNFSTQELDTIPPVITLIEPNPQTVVVNTAYVELGADCIDTAPQQAQPTFLTIDDSAVDISTIGNSFSILYDCTDTNANAATTVTRTVNVVAPNAVTTLLGSTPVVHECESTGFTYIDAGAQCSDPDDGTWTSFDPDPNTATLVLDLLIFDVTIPSVPFNLTWTCTNSAGDIGTAIRVVNVEDNTTPVPGPFTQQDPVSNLSGSVLTLETNDEAAYANLNPTLESVSDSCDTTLSPLVMTADTVDFVIVSGNVKTSTLNYTTTDASGNVMNEPLTVNVNRSEPVITKIGDNLILNVGEAYVEQGIDIFDAQDGSISGVTTSGVVTPTTAGTDPASPRDLTVAIDSSAVDTGANGVYEVTYDVTDFDGNTAVQVIRTVTVGVFATGSNFTMLDAQGDVFGGTNDVIFDWDQSLNTSESERNFNMTISSQQPFPFFGFVWTAHHTRAFGPGIYSFDTGCTVAEIEATGCPAGSAANSGPTMTMTVPAGHVGAHILFDWNTTDNIDVVNVWDASGTGVWDRHGGTLNSNKLYDGLAGEAPDPTTTWRLVSLDVNDDGFNGSPMLDGPFQGFYANYNAGPGGTAPPPEPYSGTAPDTKIGTGLALMNVWGLFAGLLTLFGFRRFNKKQ